MNDRADEVYEAAIRSNIRDQFEKSARPDMDNNMDALTYVEVLRVVSAVERVDVEMLDLVRAMCDAIGWWETRHD